MVRAKSEVLSRKSALRQYDVIRLTINIDPCIYIYISHRYICICICIYNMIVSIWIDTYNMVQSDMKLSISWYNLYSHHWPNPPDALSLDAGDTEQPVAERTRWGVGDVRGLGKLGLVRWWLNLFAILEMGNREIRERQLKTTCFIFFICMVSKTSSKSGWKKGNQTFGDA